MENSELVFVPAPLIGHLVSITEFAKQLLDRDGRLSITVLIIQAPLAADADSYTQSLIASDTRIRYITLPPVDLPSLDLLECPENFLSIYIDNHKPHAKDAIIKHVVSCSGSLAGLVLDFCCTSMIDVANELNVPSYLFFTSTAGFLGLMNHLPIHHKINLKPFDLSDPDSIIPTYSSPVPSSVIPSVLLNKVTGYECFLKHGSRFKETNGFMINTFSELEPYAVNALVSDQETPPIYAVGPLIDFKNARKRSIPGGEKIMKWLDAQPSSSVVFLCFGSLGGFAPAQLVEMAIALERSGHRFLWSINQVGVFGKAGISNGKFDLGELLPEGFLEKTKERGLVCGWAPQVDILAHEAIGGFVSHCGWNSILESLWYGVPIVTWPTYAEQQLNAFEMVKELGLAVELRLDYRNDGDILVDADEIEKAITLLMDNENSARRRMKEMGEMSRNAVKDGGSSFLALGRFVEKILETSKV